MQEVHILNIAVISAQSHYMATVTTISIFTSFLAEAFSLDSWLFCLTSTGLALGGLSKRFFLVIRREAQGASGSQGAEAVTG